MSNEDQTEIDILENKLHDLEKQYIKKIRKLKKQNRAAAAHAYVQQRLKEEAEQTEYTDELIMPKVSSCKKQRSKSSSAFKQHKSNRRPKSSSHLECDDAEAWHQKASRQESVDSAFRNQAINQSLNHQGFSISEKAMGQNEIGRKKALSALETNEENQHNCNQVMGCKRSNLSLQIKPAPIIKTEENTCLMITKHNVKIPVSSDVKSENEKNDIFLQMGEVSGSSENMFQSSPTTNVVNYQSDRELVDTESDQVIIIPCHEELVQNKENLRSKIHLSKLKLSKYKNKNFVNPVKKENLFVEEKKHLRIDEETKRQALDVDRNDVQSSDNCEINNIGKECVQLEMNNKSTNKENLIAVDNLIAGGDNSEQRGIFIGGEVIIFERQLRTTDKSDESESKISETVSKNFSENSSLQSSKESSKSAPCDKELFGGHVDNNKNWRRSGSRKRRSSGLETQRRSSRITRNSSQESWYQSNESEGISPVFLTADKTAAKKRVIISSMFQCLIDEGRRKNVFEEFNIPDDMLESVLKNGLNCTAVDEKNGITVTASRANNGICSELGIKHEQTMHNDHKSVEEELQNETDNIEPMFTEQPTTETREDNLLGKDDVISPTLFESQLDNGKVISFSKEATDDVVYCETVILEYDFADKEYEQVMNENGKMIKENEFAIVGNELKIKENRQVLKDDMQMIEKIGCMGNKQDNEKDQRNKHKEFSDKENDHYGRDRVLKNKKDDLSLTADKVKHLSLGQQHTADIVNIEIDENKSERSSGLQFQQMGDFQVPKSENVHSVMCVDVFNDDKIQPYVVCLCSSCLKLYTICNNQWTCVANSKLGFITKKKSGNLMYLLPDSDSVSLVLLGIKTECTGINQYTFTNQKWQQTTLDQVFSKSVQACALSSRLIVVSYYIDERTYVCKYIQDFSNDQWSKIQLDSTEAQISHLLPVKHIPDAILALTKSSEIQIWNHEHGYLLTSVDISDVCPTDPVCSISFSEQGFLFVPLLSKKKGGEVGTIVVINPSMNTSETLSSLIVPDSWTGCNGACIMSDDLLLCRQNNGCIRIWNVFTGDLLATVDDVTVTCFSATNLHLVAAHKQCVHVYKQNIRCL